MFFSNWNKQPDEEKIYRWTEFFDKLDNSRWKMHTSTRARKQKYISIYISLYIKTFLKKGVYIYIYMKSGSKIRKRAGRFPAATAPFPKSGASYFRFARLIRSHYTIWESGTAYN